MRTMVSVDASPVLDRDLPVLPASLARLAALGAGAQVTPRMVAAIVGDDPLLALAVLRMAQAERNRPVPATLEQAVFALGVPTVNRAARALPFIDKDLPEPMRAPLKRALARGALAARIARVLAQTVGDSEPEEVALSALLHRLGEVVLWARGDRRMPGLRAAIVQGRVAPHEAEYVLLGRSLESIGEGLVRRWQLPPLVGTAMLAHNARAPRELLVMLSAQLARHAVGGWRDPLLVHHLAMACRHIQCPREPMIEILNEVANQFGPLVRGYGLPPFPLLSEVRLTKLEAQPEPSYHQSFCLAPRRDLFRTAVRGIETAASEDAAIQAVLHGAHHGLALNRAFFARLDPDSEMLTVTRAAGTDYEPALNRLQLRCGGDDLIGLLLRKPTQFWLNPQNQSFSWPLVPENLRNLIGVQAFFMTSVFVHGKAFGLFYADRRSESCGLDNQAFTGFQALTALATRHLEALPLSAYHALNS
ncbi:MAG: HDOD domain-containing protein [Chromatiales bacterium]|nr:HDOD domain-containing protein [Chromatiales bacterium]